MTDVVEVEMKESSRASAVIQEKPKVTLYAAWSATFVALTGLWQYGFSVGSVNAAKVPIMNDILTMYKERWHTNVTVEFIDAVWVVSSAAFPAGGMMGTLLVGPLVRIFGRKNGILAGHIVTIFLSVFISLTKIIRSPEVMILCRFGFGITTGAMGTGICVMYVVEVSPQHARGIFGSIVGLAIGVGLMMSNVFGLPQLLGHNALWPLLLAMTGLPSVLFLLLMKTLPESPRELFMEDDKVEEAGSVLSKLNGVSDVSHLLNDMREEKKDYTSENQMKIAELLTSSELRSPLLAALAITAAQQLTGLNGVAFNMNDIYMRAGIPYKYVHYASIATTAMLVSIHALTTPLTEKCGRRILLIYGYAVEGVSLLILTASIETQHLNSAMLYVAVAASIGFWIGFSIGPGPVTLLIVAEFFEQASRPAAITLCMMTLWFGFIVTVVATPYMLASIRGYTFLPYAIICFVMVCFIVVKVPETKNQTFSQIRRSFLAKKNTKTSSRKESAFNPKRHHTMIE